MNIYVRHGLSTEPAQYQVLWVNLSGDILRSLDYRSGCIVLSAMICRVPSPSNLYFQYTEKPGHP